jgi:hypothetical protein
VITYEQRLNADSRWALAEGSMHFQEGGSVHETLRRITARLDALGVAYAVAGGMALFHHGYRRFTEDVDLLVTREGLTLLHEELEGRGYLPPFPQSKNLRDTSTGVAVEFLVTGGYPGDGKPKPVRFPDPVEVQHTQDGISYLNVETLVELKLASGMTGQGRLKDLADVSQLIKLLGLPLDFDQRLNPWVRQRYLELWEESREIYARVLRGPLTAADRALIEQMTADGVELGARSAPERDYYYLTTTNPETAAHYEMHPEGEVWDLEP